MDEFSVRGWARFPLEPALADWAVHANKAALKAEAAPAEGMLRCGGTWFVGVNALDNDAEGRLPGGPPLTGAAVDFAMSAARGRVEMDRAQASVCYAGYPNPGAEESEAAHRYRRDRDAAHVDGLHRIMPGRRRMLKERHAFILGLPLNEAPADAAPFVVWEGSHEVMRAAMREALGDAPTDRWAETDVTDIYQTARRRCFERLRRVEISARPGEAYVVHRLALHGVAPWAAEPGAGARRAIAYFRPEVSEALGARWWLEAP